MGADILALFTQLIGAVLIAGTQVTDKDAVTKLQRGKDIALIGVSIQIGAFGLFTVVAARFQFTSKRFKKDLEKRWTRASDARKVMVNGCPRPINPNWVAMLWAINASCLLIMVRNPACCLPAAFGRQLTLAPSRYDPCSGRSISPKERPAILNDTNTCKCTPHLPVDAQATALIQVALALTCSMPFRCSWSLCSTTSSIPAPTFLSSASGCPSQSVQLEASSRCGLGAAPTQKGS